MEGQIVDVLVGFITFECGGFCGRTLAQYLANREKDVEEKEILLLFQQMVDALCYIHSNSILHR